MQICKALTSGKKAGLNHLNTPAQSAMDEVFINTQWFDIVFLDSAPDSSNNLGFHSTITPLSVASVVFLFYYTIGIK